MVNDQESVFAPFERRNQNSTDYPVQENMFRRRFGHHLSPPPRRRLSRSIAIGKLLFISAGSVGHRKLLSSFIIFKSRGHMKNFLHILSFRLLHSELAAWRSMHNKQQASLPTLKSESRTNTAQRCSTGKCQV